MSKIIKISADFSKTPGPRFISQGDFSGEQFRKEFLQKALDEAIETNTKFTVNLDGGYGYFESFIEEAFGGLQRENKNVDVWNYMSIISNEDESWIEKIKVYVSNSFNNK